VRRVFPAPRVTLLRELEVRVAGVFVLSSCGTIAGPRRR
jgi:hypothetical protein